MKTEIIFKNSKKELQLSRSQEKSTEEKVKKKSLELDTQNMFFAGVVQQKTAGFLFLSIVL